MQLSESTGPVVSPNLLRFRPFEWIGQLSEGRNWAYILIFPSLFLIIAIVLYPVASGIALSFQEARLTRPNLTGFVGFEHYLDIFQDRVFHKALINTVFWVIAGTTTQFLLGLITALALNRSGILIKIGGVLVLLPWILPSVVAGNMWALMLDSRLGVVNELLVRVGLLDSYKAWFADPATALPTVLLVALWRGFPFFALLLLAGLQAIDNDLYEAASVDGANPLQQFVRITLPMLRPVMVATIVLRVISEVNSPDLMIILTNGGPGDSTQVLSLYAFQKAYSEFDFGYAGALSVIMFLILMIFTILYVRMSRVTQE